MRVNEEAVCKICKRIFCCEKCRRKHEIRSHAIIVKKLNTSSNKENINDYNNTYENDNNNNTNNNYKGNKSKHFGFVMCPICEKKPFAFHIEVYEELMVHIAQNHLPLYCHKCYKIYQTLEDLQDFTKCLNPSVDGATQTACSSVVSDEVCDSDSSKVTVAQASPKKISSISTQTSPMPINLNDTHLTPISKMNLKWKAKSKVQEEIVSDSTVSLKNVSSINCSIRRSIGTELVGKAKLIRSTSTPVQLGITMLKQCDQVFNGSTGHVSSICSSSCDSDTSPALPTNNAGTPRNTLENLNRYRKVVGRPKLSAVTPLRQVMSKSIQKAFAEHGGLPSKKAYQPRINMFDSANLSSFESSAQVAPLDLRSSPVIRRTQSNVADSSAHSTNSNEAQQKETPEKGSKHREYILSTHKKTMESVTFITKCQQTVSFENNFVNENSSASSSTEEQSLRKNNFSTASNGLSQTNASAGSGSTTGNSVFKSCQSVEIITSTTEVSSVAEVCQSLNENEDELDDLPEIQTKHIRSFSNRMQLECKSSSVMKNNMLKFETPVRKNKNTNYKNGKREQNKSSSPSEVFFTPNSTPKNKTSEKSPKTENCRKLASRNLNKGFSPYISLSLRNCAQSTAFSRIEDYSDNFEEEDVFLQESKCLEDNRKILQVKEETETQNYNNNIRINYTNNSTDNKNNKREADSSKVASGRLWSLVSSVIGLPPKKTTTSNDDNAERDERVNKANKTDYLSKSIIKRCASIAGSLVRSKSLVEDDQLQTLKRKRTYTIDESAFRPLHQNKDYFTSPTNISSKRFRIQGRKPIERMRHFQ